MSGIAISDRTGGPTVSGGRGSQRPGVLLHLSGLARHLNVLMDTGTPLADALRATERQAKDEEWRDMLVDLGSRVSKGESLAEAMAAHPREFDQLTVSLVAAGEASGSLTAMLERVSKLARQRYAVRKSVSSALTYPVFLIAVCLAVMVVMLAVVVPRFGEMFGSIGAPLPASTEYLLVASEIIREKWWIVAPVGAALFGGLIFALMKAPGSPTIDRLLTGAPVIGPLRRSLSSARFARTLGSLLGAKIPLLDALALVGNSMGSVVYVEAVRKAASDVEGGGSLGESLESAGLFLPTLVETTRSGEVSAKLSDCLSTLADHLDEDNAVAIKTATSFIEPVILVILGLVVGGVTLSMFLPLFDITAMAGSGVR
ncbi:MAG: type II secretion system F family protein [Planctomycetota bacterium]